MSLNYILYDFYYIQQVFILKSNRIMELFYKIFMHQKFIIKRHAEERHLDKIHSLNRV